MNSYFSFKRVGLLIKWQFADKQFKTIQLIVWGILFISFHNIGLQMDYDVSTMILLFGFIFASSQYSFFGNNNLLVTNYLLIPTSNLERITVSFLLSTVYYFCIVSLVYVVCNLLGAFIGQSFLGIHQPINWDFFTSKGMQVITGHNSFKNIDIWTLFAKVAFLQAFLILFAFVRRQNLVTKVLVALIVTGLYFAILNPGSYLFKLITGNNYFDSPNIISHTGAMIQKANSMIYYLAAAILWRINYSLLSKKQLY